MITQEFAEHFAAEWIAAWNARDLDRVLAHYSEDFEMASPLIAQIVGEPSGQLRGKPAIRAYWSKALERIPVLHFELREILVGAQSITLYYKGTRSMAAEVFFFGPDGLVVQAAAHYA